MRGLISLDKAEVNVKGGSIFLIRKKKIVMTHVQLKWQSLIAHCMHPTTGLLSYRHLFNCHRIFCGGLVQGYQLLICKCKKGHCSWWETIGTGTFRQTKRHFKGMQSVVFSICYSSSRRAHSSWHWGSQTTLLAAWLLLYSFSRY